MGAEEVCTREDGYTYNSGPLKALVCSPDLERVDAFKLVKWRSGSLEPRIFYFCDGIRKGMHFLSVFWPKGKKGSSSHP